MMYLVTFQDQGTESSISPGPFEGSHSVVNFTARQCSVEADNEAEAREIVEAYNTAPRYNIYNNVYVPVGFVEVIKVEELA